MRTEQKTVNIAVLLTIFGLFFLTSAPLFATDYLSSNKLEYYYSNPVVSTKIILAANAHIPPPLSGQVCYTISGTEKCNSVCAARVIGSDIILLCDLAGGIGHTWVIGG